MERGPAVKAPPAEARDPDIAFIAAHGQDSPWWRSQWVSAPWSGQIGRQILNTVAGSGQSPEDHPPTRSRR